MTVAVALVLGVEPSELSWPARAVVERLAELDVEAVGALVDAIRDHEREATTQQLREVIGELVAAISAYRVANTLGNDHRLATARRRALDAAGLPR